MHEFIWFLYFEFATGNDVLMKQIRTLKTKKAAAVAATKTKKATKQLDEATIKEVNISNLCLIVVYRLRKWRYFCDVCVFSQSY